MTQMDLINNYKDNFLKREEIFNKLVKERY